jgi:hypothetical protein
MAPRSYFPAVAPDNVQSRTAKRTPGSINMSRTSTDELSPDGTILNGFDYALQVWVKDGTIGPCGHPAAMRKNGYCCNQSKFSGLNIALVPGHEVRKPAEQKQLIAEESTGDQLLIAEQRETIEAQACRIRDLVSGNVALTRMIATLETKILNLERANTVKDNLKS